MDVVSGDCKTITVKPYILAAIELSVLTSSEYFSKSGYLLFFK